MTAWIITTTFLAVAHFFVNVALCREIFFWVPLPGRRIASLAALCCIPMLGAIWVYRNMACHWFGKRGRKSTGAGHIASGALLEMDAVFDPGKRYVIAAMQEERVEILKDKPN